MTAPTHIAFAAASALATISSELVPAPELLAGVSLVVGALAPDLDAKRSVINSPAMLFERLLPRFVVRVCNIPARFLSGILNSLFGHRGIFHWPLFGLCLLLTACFLQVEWLFWFSFGYFSHLIADFCTHDGLPLFAPFSAKRIRWSPIKTGSFAESALCTVLFSYICTKAYLHSPTELQIWAGQTVQTTMELFKLLIGTCLC